MMIRFVAMVFLLAAIGCTPKVLDKERALKTLLTHTEQIRQAILQEDHKIIVDLSHPVLLDAMGGRDGLTQKLTEIANESKNQGFGFADVVIAKPSEMIESEGKVYSIVKYNLKMTGPQGATGVTPSFLIAVSSDGGESWKFIDGAGISSDRAKLRQIMPDFPNKLELPPKQPTKWKH